MPILPIGRGRRRVLRPLSPRPAPTCQGGLAPALSLPRPAAPGRWMILTRRFPKSTMPPVAAFFAAIDTRRRPARSFHRHSGPAREGRFDQRITLTSSAPSSWWFARRRPVPARKGHEKAPSDRNSPEAGRFPRTTGRCAPATQTMGAARFFRISWNGWPSAASARRSDRSDMPVARRSA